MRSDPQIIYEIWGMFPGQLGTGRTTYEIVAGLLRGQQTYSLSDPVWMTFSTRQGVARLGRLRCVAEGRTCATVVLAAYALGEACPLPLVALASRLLAEGRAQPVEDLGS